MSTPPFTVRLVTFDGKPDSRRIDVAATTRDERSGVVTLDVKVSGHPGPDLADAASYVLNLVGTNGNIEYPSRWQEALGVLRKAMAAFLNPPFIPTVNVALPDGDNRDAKVRFVDWERHGEVLNVALSVSEPAKPDVRFLSRDSDVSVVFTAEQLDALVKAVLSGGLQSRHAALMATPGGVEEAKVLLAAASRLVVAGGQS